MSAMAVGMAVSVTGASAAAVVLYRQVVSGALTLDVGVGRRTAALGPITIDIAASRELVFEVIAAPYLGRAGAAGDHIDVLERGSDLVVAAHRTPVGSGLVATTVEAVGFDPPAQVSFRLLRGPVPHVQETFSLDEVGDGTRLRYDGEIGTDFWWAGQLWGSVVARAWERTVQSSLDDIRDRSEQRAAAQRRRLKAPGT
jgi:hypothetical protein